MATKKSKSAKKQTTKATDKKVVKTEPVVKTVKKEVEKKVETKEVIASGPAKKCGFWKCFFGRKYDANETILTIFKSPKIYGALIGEIIGVMLLTIFFLSFGVLEAIGMNITFQMNLQVMFAVTAVTLVVFGISGANLNPIITFGMMATRRMSCIRGVLYVLAQIIGAWVGYAVVSGFYNAGGEAASTSVLMPELTAVTDEKMWLLVAFASVSALILGFFFARALKYKKSAFTFASIVGFSTLVAMLIIFALQTSFFDYPETYNLAANAFTFNNPAVALVFQLLPSEGADFATIVAEVGKALLVYVVFPAAASIAGFYLADVSDKMSNGCDEDCTCGC
jgi:glycerol uptake facilitator-like aquaporin